VWTVSIETVMCARETRRFAMNVTKIILLVRLMDALNARTTVKYVRNSRKLARNVNLAML
jgi:hypothetical protein